MACDVVLVPEVRARLGELNDSDPAALAALSAAVDLLRDDGPELGCPLVDEFMSATTREAVLAWLPAGDPAAPLADLAGLKVLRPDTPESDPLRLIFAVDPAHSAVLLVAEPKARDWTTWYIQNIPRALARYRRHLRELTAGPDS